MERLRVPSFPAGLRLSKRKEKNKEKRRGKRGRLGMRGVERAGIGWWKREIIMAG